MFSEAVVALFNLILSKLNSKKPVYNVGQRLYSRTKRNALFLEKEIFVNEIKHFRVSIEGSPIRKAVILSENALQNDQYKALGNKSKTETLLCFSLSFKLNLHLTIRSQHYNVIC